MGKNLFNIILLITMVFCFVACNEEDDKIIGKWERFGDRAEGSVIYVEQIGDFFHGKVIYSKGEMAEYGFTQGDIKWKGIDRKAPDYYEAEDLAKAIDKTGEIRNTFYAPIVLELLSDDILHVSSFAKGPENTGTHQKWKRVK